jgi:hypothetical protein
MPGGTRPIRRKNGVIINYDPYAPGMAEKYGAPGQTNPEGFDPYSDSVGAGIYSGTVKRDENGVVVIGSQFQGHNPNPGPVYSGGGYTPTSQAIEVFRTQLKSGAEKHDTKLGKHLATFPDLVNEVTTGGALPLHTCGMSRENQHATAFLVEKGGDIEAVDTYGFTPLHRMASNNLPVGARALLEAGADPAGLSGTPLLGRRPTSPATVARQSGAEDVLAVLAEFPARREVPVQTVEVVAAGYTPVVGRYQPRDAADVPAGFASVCKDNGWDVAGTWAKLNGGAGGRWFAHSDSDNESYIYFNDGDGYWWIDGPDGLGAYKAPGPAWAPPCAATAWQSLRREDTPAARAPPTLSVFRGDNCSK